MKTYKAPQRKDKGSFSNKGQKLGKKSLAKKEKTAPNVDEKLKTIARGMFHAQTTKSGMGAQKNAL